MTALRPDQIFNRWFLLIAEPRVTRVLLLVVYVALAFAGHDVLAHPPAKFVSILGHVLVMLFGIFLLLGSALAGIAVLPGVWWLERAGIVSILCALGFYGILVITLGVSFAGLMIGAALTGLFVIRFFEIQPFALAPKTG